MAGWLGRASIFALPARYEPFGLLPLEAALSGCALVLGDIPSLREVWGDAAWFVPPDDRDALTAAIGSLIASPRLLQRAGRRGAGACRCLLARRDGWRLPGGLPDSHGARRHAWSVLVRVVVFCHSLVSDWNHGNAHFLRGVVTELMSRGHDVRVLEPEDGWSRSNLANDHGAEAIAGFHRAYPRLRSETYSAAALDVDAIVGDADLVIVHEWTDHDLVAAIGRSHARRGDRDPAVSRLPSSIGHRPGGDVRLRPVAIRRRPRLRRSGARSLSPAPLGGTEPGPGTRPRTHRSSIRVRQTPVPPRRSRRTFAATSSGSATGVTMNGRRSSMSSCSSPSGDSDSAPRSSVCATRRTRRPGWRPTASTTADGCPTISHRRCTPRFAITVHVPRRPYLESLPGIPTIRPFEALACGIPLVSARWDRTGGLFSPGEDFLVARDGDEMTTQLSRLIHDPELRCRLSRRGLETIRARHTCAHRVDQLLAVCSDLRSQAVLS